MSTKLAIDTLTGLSLIAGRLLSAAESPIETNDLLVVTMNPAWLRAAGEGIFDSVGILTEILCDPPDVEPVQPAREE